MTRIFCIIAVLFLGGNALGETVAVEKAKKPVLQGFDFNLTLWEVSGLDGAPGAYENQLIFIFEPRFEFGKRFFKGRWAEPMFLSARLLLENELVGADAQFRGSSFASPAILRDAPEQVAIADVASSSTAGGTERRAVISDLWISLFHDKVATIPKVGIDLQLGARLVLPTSAESRIAGLQAAPSLYVGLAKKLWRFHLSYGVRAVKYFYSTTTAPIAHIDGAVMVNGQNVTPLQIASTGRLNPSWGVVNAFGVSVDLPKGFSLEADYLIFNSWTYDPGPCTVPDVPAADVCADGLALGQLRRPAQRDSQWFLFEADWHATSWFTIGVGLSTYQPSRSPNGEARNPFVSVDRNNYTTVFMSLSANAEALATAIQNKRRH